MAAACSNVRFAGLGARASAGVDVYSAKEPLQVPKGSKIVSTAWYDNSAGNKSNPDPKVDVKWGDQTWEEMQYTGILYSVKTISTTSALTR